MKAYYVQNDLNSERWFFTNKAEAQKFANAENRADSTNDCYVEEVTWAMNKKGIITLLNSWACNGDQVT